MYDRVKINWFDLFCFKLRDCPDGDIWCNLGDEIMCKSEEIANAVVDLLLQLYHAQGEEFDLHTGYYDPEEDKRSGEEDRCTGWWYINAD